MAQTEETVSVSLTREEIDLLIGTIDDTEFDLGESDDEEDEDTDSEVEAQLGSDAANAEAIKEKLEAALKLLGTEESA